jgi:hypothetical protein
MEFQTVLSGVRPARIAVLIDKNNADWAIAVQHILEFLTQLWGGEHSLLIPTDGSSIDPVFWTLLNKFDPDYVYTYLKTGRDDRLKNPEQFKTMVEREITSWLKQNPGSDESYARPEIEDIFLDHSYEFKISDELKDKIARELVPFNFEKHLSGAIRADSTPGHHLTAIADVLGVSEHEKQIVLVRNSSGEVPLIWYASSLGLLSPSYLSALENAGLSISEHDFSGDDTKKLIHFVVGAMNGESGAFWMNSTPEEISTLSRRLPFTFSMLHLSRYRSVQYRDYSEPVVAVAGNTLEDFCLYFALSRLRDRVVWILPSITEKAIKGECKAEYNPPEFNFVAALDSLARGNSQRYEGLDLVSISLSDSQLQSLPTCFSAALMGSDFHTGPKINRDIESLIRHPFQVYETANIDRDQTKIVVDDELPGFFETPKPRLLRTIIPQKHRWIVDLRFDKYHLPKHAELAPFVVSIRNAGNQDVRMSSKGPSYYPLSFMIPGGEDIDRVLVKPQLRRPSAISVIEILARSGGFKRCSISDKGFYSQDSLNKFGGLQPFAQLFHDSKKRRVLKKFLDTNKNQTDVFDEGALLSIDRRRYLNFSSMQKIMGSAEATAQMIDELLRKGIILRGLIFKCKFCRNSDWFAIGQVGQQFDCRRCGRSQYMTRENWFGADADKYEASFYYKLDEIVFQGLRNDMDTPLLALAAIQERCEESFLFAPEMWFFEGEDQKPWMEADLLCIPDGILTLGEVKSANTIAGTTAEEKASLQNYRELAIRLGARRIVFATGSSAWSSSTQANIDTVFQGSQIEIEILSAEELLS